MKAKKSDILKVYAVLEHLSQGTHAVKFSYFIAKNKKKLKDEVELLKELGTPTEKYQEYDVRRAELAKSLADVDQAGRPIVQNNSYVIIKNKEDFDQKVQALKDEYEDSIKEFDEKIGQYKEILKEEMEFDGHAINVQDLPEKIEPAIIELFMDTGLLQD
jgi:outer membrane protein OmpA-like peptidoglycan-associated protein